MILKLYFIDRLETELSKSEIEEKLTPDAFNRNKVVMNLRKKFPFFSTKKEREKEELIHSNIFKSDSKIECRNTQNNLERIYKYKTKRLL